MKKLLSLLAGAAVAASLLSCELPEGSLVLPGAGDHVVSQWPIVNGFPPDSPEHGATVALHQLTNNGYVYVLPFCSGTLIAPDVVMTAGHCLNTGTGPKVRTMKPQSLAVYVGDDPQADILDHLYGTTETLIHPSYNPYALTNDIALVRLATAVVEPVAPVPNLPASLGLTGGDVGGTVNFAGFGQDETGVHGVKLQVDGTIGGLGCSVAGCPGPGDAATQFSYNQYASGPCFGDSGGPAFIDRGGVIYVEGITSYGDSNCTVYGVSTRADAYEDWIADFTAPPPPPPDCSADGFCNPECLAGEDPDCGGGGSCGDGVCGAGESCDGRSGTTACSSDCAGKTNGNPNGRYCYVEGVCEGPGCPP